MQKKIAIATLVIALLLINGSIYIKEALLANGTVVYLKLAPVDPRSLMQGDYMSLRFEIANQIRKALKDDDKVESKSFSQQSIDGLVSVQLDQRNIASFVALVSDNNKTVNTEEHSPNRISLQFRTRKGRIKFATNAFFFEEGTGKAFETAQYGKFRVSDNGELLLVSLHNETLSNLSPLYQLD